MPIIHHNPATVPPPVGNYSHGVELVAPARLLLISGQIPEHVQDGIPADFDGQCREVWRNIKAVLGASGLGLEDLVEIRTTLVRRADASANSRIRQELLPAGARPAVSVVIGELLDPAWKLEIEAMAAR